MSTQHQMVTVELSWLDGQDWASVWVCTPDGVRVSWEGFIHLSAAALRGPAVSAVTTVVLGDLRRALFTLTLPDHCHGSDGAQATASPADLGAG